MDHLYIGSLSKLLHDRMLRQNYSESLLSHHYTSVQAHANNKEKAYAEDLIKTPEGDVVYTDCLRTQMGSTSGKTAKTGPERRVRGRASLCKSLGLIGSCAPDVTIPGWPRHLGLMLLTSSLLA